MPARAVWPPLPAEARLALAAAIARFINAGLMDFDGRYAAIGEALNWAASLDDRLHREASIRPDLCMALLFARNRNTHDLATPIKGEGGFPVPILSWPWKSEFHYVFRPVEELPLPEKGVGSGKVARAQRAAYERAWQGKPVEDVLRALGNHLGAGPLCCEFHDLAGVSSETGLDAFRSATSAR